MEHRLKLSQCMIVKNEEDNIRQALSWGKDVVWEQIVVDTGSTDRTVEIAESMGAKVYHFEWIDDFSAAKNFALKQATGDWIAFLDADEYLTPEWAKKIVPLLEKVDRKQPCYAVRTPLLCIDEAGNVTHTARHCRFFKNMTGLQYQGAIHEVLRLNGEHIPDQGITDIDKEFPVYHTGYQAEVMERKNKNQRNIRLLKKELEKDPNNYNVMGYLGDSYRIADNEQEAEQWYRKSIALMPARIHVRDERSAITFVYLLQTLACKGDEDAFLEIYEKAITYVPWVYDCDFIAGKYFYTKKNYEKTVYHLERALQVTEQYGASAYGICMTSEVATVWELLAWCYYYEKQDLQKCVQYCVPLLKADKSREHALNLLLKALKGEQPQAVFKFMANFYRFDVVSDRLMLLKGLIKAESYEILSLLRAYCTKEELEFLQQMGLSET